MKQCVLGLSVLLLLSFLSCTSANKAKPISFPAGSQDAIDNQLIIDYLKENKETWPMVKQTEKGIYYRITEEGEGDLPSLMAQVKIQHEGKLLSGEVFENSFEREHPVQMRMNSAPKGLRECASLLKQNGEGEFIIPSSLAFGSRGTPKVPANSVLVYRVRLIEIDDPKKHNEHQIE